MPDFVSQIVGHLTRASSEGDLGAIKTVESFLVGKVVFKEVEAVGSSEWWQKKTKEDKKNAKTAVFLDLDFPPASASAVAHQSTCEKIELHLLTVRPGRGYAKGGKGAEARTGVDAFTGESGELTTSFPEPRVQVLRPPDLKLFSASGESACLTRYGLIESAIFPVGKSQSARMQNAILKLAAKKEQRGKTWFPIPSSLNERKKPKTDLLVAYLEDEPESRAPLAEMFGGAANSFSDADFEAIAQPVLEMLEGKASANPNLKVRLLAFCPIDKGKKQISLNRCFHVRDVIRAARDWEAGARNVPDVSIWFHDKRTKQSVLLIHYCPSPLELASTINLVWNSKADGGFIDKYQRAVSVADAFEVFVTDSPLAKQKAHSALALLVDRMSTVLAAVASIKNRREWIKNNKQTLSDPVRWQSVKSIALLGILLQQLGHYKKDFMQEPITQIGRLLALADSLHFQYCKFVRTSDEKRKTGKVDAPSELIGNALFNTALEQPVSALARLAERIKPYKGWADTYSGEDAGLIHWLNRQMADARTGIEIEKLPARMTDAYKAKLLLGYLADHSKTETPKQ
jgi:hypothetical protein